MLLDVPYGMRALSYGAALAVSLTLAYRAAENLQSTHELVRICSLLGLDYWLCLRCCGHALRCNLHSLRSLEGPSSPFRFAV